MLCTRTWLRTLKHSIYQMLICYVGKQINHNLLGTYQIAYILKPCLWNVSEGKNSESTSIWTTQSQMFRVDHLLQYAKQELVTTAKCLLLRYVLVKLQTKTKCIQIWGLLLLGKTSFLFAGQKITITKSKETRPTTRCIKGHWLKCKIIVGCPIVAQNSLFPGKIAALRLPSSKHHQCLDQ